MRVDDDFPFEELECQYYVICRDFVPKKCGSDKPCMIRDNFRYMVEPYIARGCLDDQVRLIGESWN